MYAELQPEDLWHLQALEDRKSGHKNSTSADQKTNGRRPSRPSQLLVKRNTPRHTSRIKNLNVVAFVEM